MKNTITKTNSLTKKLLSIIMAAIMCVSMFAGTTISAQAATAVKTGRFGNGYTTVYLNKDKKGKLQNAKIKVCSFDKLGVKNNAKLHITLRTTSGKWICEFDATSGTTLNLGNDHSAYRVYIAPVIKQSSNDSLLKSIANQASDFNNSGKCVYWSIDATKNCHF